MPFLFPIEIFCLWSVNNLLYSRRNILKSIKVCSFEFVFLEIASPFNYLFGNKLKDQKLKMFKNKTIYNTTDKKITLDKK